MNNEDTTAPVPPAAPAPTAAAATPPVAVENPVGLLLDNRQDFQLALTLGTDLPKTRNGLPVTHFYKESLVPGTFKDARGKTWTITAKDIDDALADTKRALAMGHEPTIQDDHFKPTKSFGFVTGARKNKRGGLDLLHSFMGDDARDEALRRKTSIMLIPNFEDAHGNRYKWFPDHSAAVFRPQLKNLKDYEPALAASTGQTVDAVTLTLAGDDPQPAANPPEEPLMDMTQLRAYLGQKADGQPDDKLPAIALAALTEKDAALALAAAPPKLDVSPLRAMLGEENASSPDADVVALAAAAFDHIGKLWGEAERERDEARQQALALSAEQPAGVDPHVMALSNKDAERAIQFAERSNGITPAQAKYLRDLKKADPSLALSADTENATSRIDDFIAFAAMADNAPVPADPIKRGVPAKPTKAAMALSGDDSAVTADDVSEDDKRRLRELFNIPQPAAK